MSEVRKLDRAGEAQRLAERGHAEERRGTPDAALACYDAALELLVQDPPTPLFADVLRWKGTVLRERGSTEAAEAQYGRSLEVSTALGYAAGEAHALNCLAIIAQRRGDMAEAERQYDRAALLAMAEDEHRLLGMIEQNLGVMAAIQGRTDVALLRYRLSLQAFEVVEDVAAIALVLNNLGMLHVDQRQYAEAERVFERGLAMARSRGDLMVEGTFELNRAELFVALGRWADAERACDRSLEIAEARRDRLRCAETLRILATIERERDRLEHAVRSLEEAWTIAGTSDDVLLSAEVQRELGEVWRRRGDRGKARAAYESALGGFRRLGAARDASEVEVRLGRL